MSGLTNAKPVAFVSSRNLSQAREFYEHTLALTFVNESPYACVFDANGTMLRVTYSEELAPAPYTVLGWDVADIAATVRDLGRRGVTFMRFEGMPQDDLGIWTTPGGERVAWFKDPDDNTLSVTQFSAP